MPETLLKETLTCYHCGDECKDAEVSLGEKNFCCQGCKLVYEILRENDLCTYYDLSGNPGVSLKGKSFGDRYAYLSNEEIAKQLLDFSDAELSKITLYIPSIHCSSCIWLLENLYKLREGITSSRVNFMRKELSLSFNPQTISLKEVVELLATIGYAPDISLENYQNKNKEKTGKSIFLKIGVVGFCTGNIMVLSFPEYFGLGQMDHQFKQAFTWLNVILALPVFFYGASEYFISAYRSLLKKAVNIDVPLSIGILALFGRSIYEILSATGPGYLDSMAGLVFFLLIGKWLQNKTFENLSFNRNYQSYFPLAATVLKYGKQESIPVTRLAVNDKILIRNAELIPADSILLSENAWIDYSFVTGEAEPIEKKSGDYIYAGGRQIGGQIELVIKKPVSQSYLTQLWNNEAFSKEKETPVTQLADNFSRYFTVITISIALLTAGFWYFVNPEVMWQAFTAVLIVACPCALSLSMPFAMENTMRIFGRNAYYVKNPGVIQHLANISHIVFDKTGTLTKAKVSKVNYDGLRLSEEEKQMVAALAGNSTHPLSRKIFHFLSNFISMEVSDFSETSGAGIQGVVNGQIVKLGSSEFTGVNDKKNSGTKVYVSIADQYKGVFSFETGYRQGLDILMNKLRERFNLSLLSGDHEVDVPVLLPLFGWKSNLHFEQSPTDKLNFIKAKQSQGEKVLMAGDGLNDAGALKQSNVGLVLTEDVQAFFPACDVLADAKGFERLYDIIRFSRTSVNIVKVSFLLSMVYNVIGVGWAVTGNMSPVFAAVLMPVSSISVVAFAVGTTSLYARWRKL